MTDPLTETSVRPLVRGRLGSPYLYAPVCDSTQDLLRGRGLAEGAVAVAEHQTGGRGRSGRSWEDTPAASILVSVLLRPPAGRLAPELSLVCALAVAETLDAATSLTAQVKWPNDVLVRDRKAAGILLEADGDAVVCGIGVNVHQTVAELPSGTRVPPASLRTVTGRAHDRAPLLAALLDRLDERYGEWRATGLDRIAAELNARNWLRGRRVEADGKSGTASAITPDGRLELALDDGGTIRVNAGEVSLVAQPATN
jgi:BirA family biotin operon repressor/biotin-[acetyl-CoA-carboxylase] ligase